MGVESRLAREKASRKPWAYFRENGDGRRGRVVHDADSFETRCYLHD
jgi:hypothetical protein